MRSSLGLLALGIALSLGVGAAGAADKTHAVVVKAMDNPFLDPVRDGCRKATAEIAGAECLYVGPSSHAQVGQRPFEMGYRAMFVMHDLVNGKAVAPTVYTGLDTCTAETVDTCLKK